jgi:hypothetical protein
VQKPNFGFCVATLPMNKPQKAFVCDPFRTVLNVVFWSVNLVCSPTVHLRASCMYQAYAKKHKEFIHVSGLR